MPPKRRKASESTLESASKKRVTRSSTRPGSSVTQDPKAEVSKTRRTSEAKATTVKPTTTPKPKTTKSKTKPEAESNNTQEARHQEKTPSNVTTFTITSDLIKNPVQCHKYTSPDPSEPSHSTLIFTHGAGGTLSAPAVVNFCRGFSNSQSVHAFQGSMNLAARVKGFHACLENLRSVRAKGQKKTTTLQIVFGGRSMGARAAVMAASHVIGQAQNDGGEKPAIRLILVSYPLKGPKDDIRDQILLDLSELVTVLFVIGDRDSMCPLDLLESVRGKMKAKSQLVVVKGADHGMHVKPAKREREVGEESGQLAAEWVEGSKFEDVRYIGDED